MLLKWFLEFITIELKNRVKFFKLPLEDLTKYFYNKHK